MKNLVLLIAATIILVGCTDIEQIKDDLYGMWSVDFANYNGEVITKSSFAVNAFIVKREGECRFPTIVGETKGQGTWELQKVGKDVVFKVSNSKNVLFNGEYIVTIINKSTYLQLELDSDDVSLRCKKSIY